MIVRTTLQEFNPIAAPSAVKAAISTETMILKILMFIVVDCKIVFVCFLLIVNKTLRVKDLDG